MTPPTPARQLARAVLPAPVRRTAMAAVRAHRPPTPAPAGTLTLLAPHRPLLAAALADLLVHADNGEPLRRTRGVAPRPGLTAAELRRLHDHLDVLHLLTTPETPHA